MSSTSRIHLIVKSNGPFHWLAVGAQSVFLLLVRVYWGWMFMQVGWTKLQNLGQTTTTFNNLGIPAPGLMALVVGCAECLGGFLLAVGLLSRLTALVLTFEMTIAYLVAFRGAFFAVLSDPKKFYGAAPFTFFFVSLLILIFGPGWIALDRLIVRMFWTRAEEERPIRPAGREAA